MISIDNALSSAIIKIQIGAFFTSTCKFCERFAANTASLTVDTILVTTEAAYRENMIYFNFNFDFGDKTTICFNNNDCNFSFGLL